MGLRGKLVAAIEFRAGGDVFHELLRHRPHDISSASPGIIQGCDLHQGDYGHVGSIISWRYTHVLIRLKTLEGELMELYTSFVATIHVETHDGVDLVTVTLEYGMVNEDVEHPVSLLSLFIDMTKDIETHHS